MIDLPPTEFFVGLLSSETERLHLATQRLFFPAGRVIFPQGDPGNGLYVVETGTVEISAAIHGEENRVLSRMGPETFFGEMAMLDNQPRSATATAVEDTVAIFIAREEMLRALGQSPALLSAMLREFSLRVRRLDHRFLEEMLHAERFAFVGRFAQAIVHDFKNPLNIIGFAAELAADETATAEHRKEAKAQIQRQAGRMTNMINELLDFTRGSTGVCDLEETNYAAFVEELLGDIRKEAVERAVTIECENAPPVETLAIDSGRLQQVFYNLINNAIDMMPKGGAIKLRFEVREAEVLTEIEDTGPGLAPEMESRLFMPFATHGKKHGTGLGLSICKRIVEDHRGKIQAHSKPGAGAVFSFTLPRMPARIDGGPEGGGLRAV
jgi:signal transduction histidine kinase